MILVTGNENKVAEFEEILGREIENINLDIKEIQSVCVEEVAEDKAIKAYEVLGEAVIAEDTGLYFDALGGLPGALIKLFVDNISLQDICDLLKDNRKARVKTCIAVFDGKEVRKVIGETFGEISREPRGENGFGWDPIFIPQGYDKTFAELSSEEKRNKFMRKEAINKLKEIL